jgi:hypothetical protein
MTRPKKRDEKITKRVRTLLIDDMTKAQNLMASEVQEKLYTLTAHLNRHLQKQDYYFYGYLCREPLIKMDDVTLKCVMSGWKNEEKK